VSWIFRTALVLRGLAAIFFCALFLAWPGLTFLVLGGILGAYAITSGVLEAIAGIDGWIKHKSGWLLTVDGVFSAVCGLAIFVIVGAHLYRLFFYWLALWPLGTGILQILTAVQLRKRLKYGWLLALAGSVSIVCGLLFGSVIFMGPVFNLLNFKWITNLYLIVPGILIMAFGFAARKKTAGSS
jgi:uncharacterized membrane protein HdeD (DUF308 family)